MVRRIDRAEIAPGVWAVFTMTDSHYSVHVVSDESGDMTLVARSRDYLTADAAYANLIEAWSLPD